MHVFFIDSVPLENPATLQKTTQIVVSKASDGLRCPDAPTVIALLLSVT